MNANIALVSSYPNSSAVGTYNRNLKRLGLYSHALYFDFDGTRIDRSSPADCFTPVRPRLLPRSVAYGLSFVVSSNWDRVIRDFDYIHVTSPEFFHVAARRRNVIGTVHDMYTLDARFATHFTLQYRALVRRDLSFLKDLLGVITVSRVTKARLEAAYPKVESTVVHHWTLDDFRPRDRAAARRELNLPSDRFIVLNVSNRSPNKNLKLLDELARELGDLALFVRVGRGRSTVSQPTSIHEVVDYVSAAQMPLYYNAADLYVATSTEEGFSHPITEAVNSGIPVVAPRIDIFREVLRDSPYLVPTFDMGDWKDRILGMMSNEERARARNWYASALGDYYRPERGREDMRRFLEKMGVA